MIIGVTGTSGAGKSTIAKYLVGNFEFKHISVRDFLTNMLFEEGKEPNRNNMRLLANYLRAKEGPDYIVKQLYQEASLYSRSVIESIRTPGEIVTLKELGNFLLIAVDADVEIRYDRVYARGSSTDKISFEEFQRQEALEQLSVNPWEQNISKCIQMADIAIHVNGGTEELFRELNTRLASKEKGEIFLY